MTITEHDLIEAILLAEFPTLDDYDPALHLSKDRAATIWNVDPRTAMARLQKMAREGKLVRIEVRNPQTNKVMQVFTKAN